MAKTPPKKPAAPSNEEEANRLLALSRLHQHVDARYYGVDGVEQAPKRGHYTMIIIRTEADGRRSTRIVTGPIAPAAKDPSTKR